MPIEMPIEVPIDVPSPTNRHSHSTFAFDIRHRQSTFNILNRHSTLANSAFGNRQSPMDDPLTSPE
jgi:hypothetical protein